MAKIIKTDDAGLAVDEMLSSKDPVWWDGNDVRLGKKPAEIQAFMPPQGPEFERQEELKARWRAKEDEYTGIAVKASIIFVYCTFLLIFMSVAYLRPQACRK